MNQKKSIAALLKHLSKIFIAVITVSCGIGGFIFGVEEMPLVGDDLPDGFIFAIIGLVVGALLSFLLSIFVLYLAELGENTKKTAEATTQSTKANSADEIMKYKKLLESGVISNDEFEAKKKQLLDL